MITAAFAPVLPFERPDDSGVYSPLSNTAAIVFLNAPSAGPSSMGVQTNDVTSFTQGGDVYVPRGSDLKAGDRVTFQARKYVLMGAANWDIEHPMTGYDYGWMMFAIQVDPAQLIADLLALRGKPITLVPASGVATEAAGGGFDYAPAAPRASQIFVLFQVSSPETGRLGKGFDSTSTSSTDKGTVRRFAYNMIGAAGSVVELGDSWEDDVATYTVDSVDYTVPYVVGATVTAFLKVTGHSGG